ncbi:MAG TPA: hypothetical protein VLV31_09445 [Candidatus Acidoferrales bacterium]|nr:hypothetical protein [Candidatus Acidoferrales bacterium]
MDVVKFSRSEWEAFFSEFSELVRRYQTLVTQLDVARSRIEGFQEKNKAQIEKSVEALSQVKLAVEKLCNRTEEVLNETER